MQPNYLIIYNPIAGKGKVDGLKKMIKKAWEGKINCKWKKTKYAGHASLIARKAIGKVDAVIAVGGDGTVNEVAAVLAGSDTPLGILPKGSGNGLARHLGIPMTMPHAIEWMAAAEVTPVDTIEVNGQFFINVAGIGFDAYVAHQFAKASTRGLATYIKETLSAYFTYHKKNYLLKWEGQQLEVKALLISIANSSQFGNDAYIAPHASLSDGLVDVSIIKDCPFWYAPAMGYRLFSKTIHKSRFYSTFQVSSVEISCQENEFVHLDGEASELQLPLDIQLHKNNLKMLCCP
ncbi:diacylglycerol kinase family protein [Persicobacter psychrovividus]|uniref:DAGKc domain-containing protein n=1 Tax=Persicobacter psychrovividus TaxID=387638 RepID=A0ABM7VAZ6_9BACT|nr:hypothetical protein PEPS_03790 [Persicobacter psychrovividus]